MIDLIEYTINQLYIIVINKKECDVVEQVRHGPWGAKGDDTDFYKKKLKKLDRPNKIILNRFV